MWVETRNENWLSVEDLKDIGEKRRYTMKNINWRNLIYDIFRCIIAYPLFLIAFVISIPFNIVGYLLWICEFVLAVLCFIFTGEFSFFKYSAIGELIIYHSFWDLMFVVFPATFILIKKINDDGIVYYDTERARLDDIESLD